MEIKDNIFSVTDASQLLKGVVEAAFPRIKIRGELSQITRAQSGHTYMTIKDSGAAISVIIWRGTPVTFELADGLEVIITGKFTTYPARSNYQIIASEIEVAGAGVILKMLEDRKKKLAAEGLFDAARKKQLPRFPRTIGIITSPTGAAFHDIQNRLRERFPVTVLLYSATVQGNTAAQEVIAGIEYFNKQKNIDVLIIARGGGSLEDLLPFSDEALVRAVAASDVPIVSGVGHEPDWMLIDFAADVRAPTPTGAAEIVVPTKISIVTEIENLSHRMTSSYISRLNNLRAHIAAMVIKSPTQTIMERAQRIDDIARTMFIIMDSKIQHAKHSIMRFDNLSIIVDSKISNLKLQISNMERMLNSLSYKNVLSRGFAIVRADNKIISKTADFKTPAEIEFADGMVQI